MKTPQTLKGKKMNIYDFIVASDKEILEVMEKIEKNAKGIIFVCEEGRLVGTVTDGDIRRYILRKGKLSQKVIKIVNYDAVWLGKKDEEQAMQIMHQRSISAVPVLNTDKEIIKIYFLNGDVAVNESKYSLLNVPVVIMAGGKGTRLKPYTDILPKPLIPIGSKTITEHIVDRFVKYGCSDVYMIVNYKKEFIKAYFRDSIYKNRIKFVDEKIFGGTGGGLKLLEGKIKTNFFMSNCDILVNADYSDILKYHQNHRYLITMVCAKKRFCIPYGAIDTNSSGDVVGVTEKPSNVYLINTGFYVIDPEILKEIPENQFIHITEIIGCCISHNLPIGAYIIEDEDWMDMGQFDEMEKMKEKLGVL